MTEKRMKILHVLTDRNIGGAGRWLLYYLKYHNAKICGEGGSAA